MRVSNGDAWLPDSYSATIAGCHVRAGKRHDDTWWVEVAFGDSRVRCERDYCPSLAHAKAWATKCAPMVAELARQMWMASMETTEVGDG